VSEGFTKVEYRPVDVRDRYGMLEALDGADVVVHLAFSLYGLRYDNEALRDINVGGSKNVLAAAAAAGATRFIYASSGAVYGFDTSRPGRVDEQAPVDPEPRHFYSQHKAEVERALLDELSGLPELSWVFFRPCAVVGPDAAGAALHGLPAAFSRPVSAAITIGAAAGLRPAIPGPAVPLQFVHARDVGQAIHRAVHGERTNGVYNLGGDGMVEPVEVPRLLGLRRLPFPGAVTRAAAQIAARVPYVAPGMGWIQAATHPLELDTTRAKGELGWKPEFTSRTALQATRRALAI
jgi:nucleoside-diphosphate-sugar epimerase